MIGHIWDTLSRRPVMICTILNLESVVLICQINDILCVFRNVTCNTKIRIIKTYCTSLYGAELWDLSNDYIDSICITWWRGVRKVWRLPKTTHSSLLPGISNTMPLIDLLYGRLFKFVYRCLSSR